MSAVYCRSAPGHPVHAPYHEAEYGFPSRDFTGAKIVEEFLLSLGYLPGAHEPDCPVFARILALSPPWMRAGSGPT